MSQQQIAALSPAEKFDIYVARYDYPTVNSEWQRTSPSDAEWEGLCHGWAPASNFFNQPNPVALTNKDQITVPFGSSDVKALLTYFVAEYEDESQPQQFIAERCNSDLDAHPELANSTECADLNAGSFHVMLANLLGSMQTGMVVDRERGIQVWNQPVFSFSASVDGPARPSAANAASAVQVTTSMSYGKETMPAWNAHPTNVVTESYKYTVELDANGNVVGGDMQSWDRVDFAWNVQINGFYGFYAPLQTIYAASTNGTHALHKMRARLPPSSHPNHRVIAAPVAAFGQGRYQLNRFRASWTLAPAQPARAIEIAFEHFNTRRYRDTVKIYEGATGEGALIAVLHGGALPQPVVVRASAAYVVFTSDPRGRSTAFSEQDAFAATFRALF
jgi:hypothetical protein